MEMGGSKIEVNPDKKLLRLYLKNKVDMMVQLVIPEQV
jgi:hypothetical protein